jgi:hypothetical protein
MIGFLSCNKVLDDIKNAKVDLVTEWGLNVADVSLMIQDTLNVPVGSFGNWHEPTIILFPGEDGILEMHLTQKLNPITLDSIVNFKDSVFNEIIQLPSVSDFFSTGDIIIGFGLGTFSKDEKFKSKKIDSLKLDAGNLKIDFDTYEHFDSRFTFTFPGITSESNEILTFRDFQPDAQNNSVELDLSGYKIQVLRKKKREYFLVKLHYYIESKNKNSRVDPIIDLTLENLDVEYAYGNFGLDTIKDIGRQEFVLFEEQIIKGQNITVDFKKPKIEVQVLNSFGLPFKYDFRKLLMFFNEGDSVEVTGIPKSIFIDAPTSYNKNSFVPSLISINPNTNIDLLLGRSPTHIVVDGDLIINPYNAGSKNYLRDKDTLSAILDINLPFELRVSQLTLKDTLHKEIFAFLDNPDFFADEIKLETDVTNGFPFELDIQAYFTNENLEIIDSLFETPVKITGSDIKNGSPVNASYFTNKNRNQIKELLNTHHAIIEAGFKTVNAEEEKIVSFKEDHKLDIQLTIFTKLNVQSGNK